MTMGRGHGLQLRGKQRHASHSSHRSAAKKLAPRTIGLAAEEQRGRGAKGF